MTSLDEEQEIILADSLALLGAAEHTSDDSSVIYGPLTLTVAPKVQFAGADQK